MQSNEGYTNYRKEGEKQKTQLEHHLSFIKSLTWNQVFRTGKHILL